MKDFFHYSKGIYSMRDTVWTTTKEVEGMVEKGTATAVPGGVEIGECWKIERFTPDSLPGYTVFQSATHYVVLYDDGKAELDEIMLSKDFLNFIEEVE